MYKLPGILLVGHLLKLLAKILEKIGPILATKYMEFN